MNGPTIEIELHDSMLTAASRRGPDLELILDAYIHHWENIDGAWKGTGRYQPVRIVVRETAGDVLPAEVPVEISDGRLIVNETVYKNMFPLPFVASGATSLWLQMTTAEELTLVGQAVLAEILGAGRYVEDLPAEFRPK